MKKILFIVLFALISKASFSQQLKFEKIKLSDTNAIASQMKELAKSYLEEDNKGKLTIESEDLYKLQILAGHYKASIESIQLLRKKSPLKNSHPNYIQYELFSKSKIQQSKSGGDFNKVYQSVFHNYLTNCNDEKALSANIIFTTYDSVNGFAHSFKSNYKSTPDTSITFQKALQLLKSYFLYNVYAVTEPVVLEEMNIDQNRRYIIKEELIISPRDGAELSVITVRKKSKTALPAILAFTIYADKSNVNEAILSAQKGYVGVVATSRGKRKSKDKIEPFKHEYKDVYAVIDWISKQKWCNAKVGMYGGSYNGFTQWASMKEKVHPALKTIVPSVSVAPGIDMPMENNIFLNFAYKWGPYVTNNKYLDYAVNANYQKWRNLENIWFKSGKPYNKMDSIDGTPNPVFQEWISHPSYDKYWQGMIPYKKEFSHIDIPILSTTGYYDDGQRGAMYYYLEHLKYNPKAEHYLLIGPYDHWGAQSESSANLRGYEIDEVANLKIREGLAFEWFDYILKGKEKPAILKDKVNFQMMGTNKWLNRPSLTEMSNGSLNFYLSKEKEQKYYALKTKIPSKKDNINLTVDLADRTQQHNSGYYPWPIVKDSINLNDGIAFMSQPLEKDIIISGSFSGELKVVANKKDFDFSMNLYELTSEGKYIHLSYYIGRASYAKSREKRQLLKPNKQVTIAFDNTRIISKKLEKGSKIVILVNGNKNAFGQVNYGTGEDVSTESISKETTPLKLMIATESKITLPTWTEKQ